MVVDGVKSSAPQRQHGEHSRVKEAGGHAVNKLYDVSMAHWPGRVVHHQLMSRETALSGWRSAQHPLTINSPGMLRLRSL